MAKDAVPVGVLFSRTGSYAAVGGAMAAGAMLAIGEVNADPGFHFTLDARCIDPAGQVAAYTEGARSLLTAQGVTHIVGCYTSSSRKEVLPVFEKHDGLLWYPSHYEGFETSDNVVYTGAAPNQHVVPLARYLLLQGRRRACFIGSNYIWAWENNRIMRESLARAGGGVISERYLPVGETDLGDVVARILRERPDFVFNTLIGDSAYTFYRLFRRAAAAQGIDQPNEIPVASCSLAEPELALIGDAKAGHLSSSVYFSSIETPENRRFRDAWGARYPALGLTSADAEASYVAVRLLAGAIAAAGAASMAQVRAAVSDVRLDAPQGPVRVDPENRHCHLRPRIGRSTEGGEFEIVYEAAAPLRPDPYLVWDAAGPAASARAALRLVS
jgi:branched-chain amino acid transport system substrate-binding protein